MTIVEAGARRDMGQLDAALRILEQAPLTSKSRESVGGATALRLRRHPRGRRPRGGRAGLVPPHPGDRRRRPHRRRRARRARWRSAITSLRSAGEQADERRRAGVLGAPLEAVAVGDPDPVDRRPSPGSSPTTSSTISSPASIVVPSVPSSCVAERLRAGRHADRAALAQARGDLDVDRRGREDLHPVQVQGAVEVGRRWRRPRRRPARPTGVVAVTRSWCRSAAPPGGCSPRPTPRAATSSATATRDHASRGATGAPPAAGAPAAPVCPRHGRRVAGHRTDPGTP